MILHLVEGFGLEGHLAHNFDGLVKLQKNHSLTHVFIAQTEYEENSGYYGCDCRKRFQFEQRQPASDNS